MCGLALEIKIAQRDHEKGHQNRVFAIQRTALSILSTKSSTKEVLARALELWKIAESIYREQIGSGFKILKSTLLKVKPRKRAEHGRCCDSFAGRFHTVKPLSNRNQ